MKAAQISEYGHVENVQVNEVAKPTPGEGQVLVKVSAASLNPFDTMVREGHARQMAELQFPATLGGDLAGVVEAVGEGVDAFKPGDQVYGAAQAISGASGAFAEYAVAAADHLAIAPSSLTLEEAAALPLVGASAVQALTEHVKIGDGTKFFVHGGTGGIGVAAIQIAASLGAHVAASAKGDASSLKAFGADEVLDTTNGDFSALTGYDVVLNLVGGTDWDKLLSVLKPGGVAVSLVGGADEAVTKAHQVEVFAQYTATNTPHLNQLRDFVEQEVVTPQIAETYSLDQIRDAFTKRESGGVNGKIVIKIAG